MWSWWNLTTALFPSGKLEFVLADPPAGPARYLLTRLDEAQLLAWMRQKKWQWTAGRSEEGEGGTGISLLNIVCQ